VHRNDIFCRRAITNSNPETLLRKEIDALQHLTLTSIKQLARNSVHSIDIARSSRGPLRVTVRCVLRIHDAMMGCTANASRLTNNAGGVGLYRRATLRASRATRDCRFQAKHITASDPVSGAATAPSLGVPMAKVIQVRTTPLNAPTSSVRANRIPIHQLLTMQPLRSEPQNFVGKTSPVSPHPARAPPRLA
jgi:hypothetical protein